MNANQRYATTAATRSLLRELARRSQTPLQDFVVRNDSSCGSTIGPIVASHTGLRTIGKFISFGDNIPHLDRRYGWTSYVEFGFLIGQT